MMAAAIPAPLKAADVARFAHRAGQLEKAKPVVAYYCKLHLCVYMHTRLTVTEATIGY